MDITNDKKVILFIPESFFYGKKTFTAGKDHLEIFPKLIYDGVPSK